VRVRAAAAQLTFWRYTAPICYGIWFDFMCQKHK